MGWTLLAFRLYSLASLSTELLTVHREENYKLINASYEKDRNIYMKIWDKEQKRIKDIWIFLNYRFTKHFKALKLLQDTSLLTFPSVRTFS